MVRIEVKHGDDQKKFVYDCQSTSTIDDVAKDVVAIANLQSEVHCLVLELERRLYHLHLHGNSKVVPLIRALSEAKSYSSQDQVVHNVALSHYVLRDHLQRIQREFIENYRALDFPDSSLEQLMTDLELLQEDKAQLWWAGRELLRCKKLCDYIGKNEKTKIILRLHSLGLQTS